ncbi:TetR/AcrR family transcriptional regulator [Paenibacillus macerans]|uniref:TetR/AcrR family transcriptional regulator n=1 Tax=Paenibacillus macerans TaxID=44252 RepID=UPI00203F4811|nr:TetR/AcrR family transcriptional regulator [Paenibacillus macerans]MCM3703896.1 TetR/AcrR family transcriptional regulator [Paenibacillus macerans]
MTDRKKRTYDAARTKAIILDAAEGLFAEHGYSATRIDAIADASGYNKSLIYQYFKDKLGLYTEVVKRADLFGNKMSEEQVGDLLKDETTASDPDKFRRLLEQVIDFSYQLLTDNPRYLKIFAWEAAENWKTWKKIAYNPDDDFPRLYKLTLAAKKNGMIRRDMEPVMVPMILMNTVIPFLQSFRRVSEIFPDDRMPPITQEQFREQIAKFVIYGVMEPSVL